MQGLASKNTDRLLSIDIDKLIPKNHLLRKIDKVLDLYFVNDLTKGLYSKNNGRPSIAPEIFIRMTLVSYLYGIKSDRQLCDQLQYNFAYRWYCKINTDQKIPNHSSMTRIRKRLGEDVFKEIFLRVVEICKRKGLIRSGKVMVDSSVIEANASFKSLVGREGASIDKVNTTSPKRIIKNDRYVSSTDPDCTIFKKNGARNNLYYKVHTTISDRSRVILDCHVSTGAVHDGNYLIPRIKATEENIGIKINQVTADRAYGIGKNLADLDTINIRSYIPNFHKNAAEHLDGFTYIEEDDVLICPNGETLTPRGGFTGSSRKYRITNNVCKDCPLKKECIGDGKYRAKVLNVNRYCQTQKKVRKRERTEIFKKKQEERMWKIEGLFGEGKSNHNLRRARYRRIGNVQIQVYMIACVQNLKRIIEHLNRFLPTF